MLRGKSRRILSHSKITFSIVGGMIWGLVGSSILASAGQVVVAIVVPLITTAGAVLTAYFTSQNYRNRPSYDDLEKENERLRKRLEKKP